MSHITTRLLHLVAFLVTLLCVGSSAYAQGPTPVPVIPGSTFVPVDGFFDFIADNPRGLVYFSRGGQILRWRRSDQQWLSPIEVGGGLCALDISPDGSTLAVADEFLSDLGSPGTYSPRVALVNLDTLTVSNIMYPRLEGERGSYSLAFDANSNLFISPAKDPWWVGPGALRVWNKATNQIYILSPRTSSGQIDNSNIGRNTAIVANTNRQHLSFFEIGGGNYKWGFYNLPSGTSPEGVGGVTRFTGAAVYPNGISQLPQGIAFDGSARFLIPTEGALHMWGTDGSLTLYAQQGLSIPSYNSVATDTQRSLLYLTPANSTKIEIRDPATFNLRASLDAEITWPASAYNTEPYFSPPYNASHMRTTSDGTLLGVRVTNGIRFYDLQNGLPTGPSLVSNSLTTPEDTPFPFILESPYRNDPNAVYFIVRQPTRGTLTGTAPNYTYTPIPDYSGSDIFAITVNGLVREVSVSITPVNDAPVAYDSTAYVYTNELNLLWLSSSDADAQYENDNNAVRRTYEVVSPPSHGTIASKSGALWGYLPDTDYEGDDSLSFRAFDGQLYSNTATISIKNAGRRPVARDDSFTVLKANTITVPAPGVLGNDTLTSINTVTPASYVSSGKVTINADGSFTWTASASGPPASNTITFFYYLTDPSGRSTSAYVKLHLVTVESQSIWVIEDNPRSLTLNAPGAVNPTFAITKQPTHGTLTGTAPDLTYTPALNYNGDDSFEFSVTNAEFIGTGIVSISIAPVPDPPDVSDSVLSTNEDTPLAVTLPASDPDGDVLSFHILEQPSVGALVADTTSGRYIYTPPANFSGSVSFRWQAYDGSFFPRAARMQINVVPVNDAPIAQSQNITSRIGRDVPVSLGATDVDNAVETLTYKITKLPEHGQLVGTAPQLSFRPEANWQGTDSFEFAVNDGALDSAPAKVTIKVEDINSAPSAENRTASGDEDTDISVTLKGTDADGDALTFQITRQPEHGTLKQEDNSVIYRGFDDWNGTDSFGYVANDGKLSSDEANVSITVRPVSDSPVARADVYNAEEDKALTVAAPGVLGNDMDVDGQTLTSVLKSQPDNGSVQLNANGSFTYTPDANWNGSDSFTYAASDGTLESAPVTVSITVKAINDAPVARDDEKRGTEDTALFISSASLLANDFDGDGDALSITAVTNPAHGTLVATEGGYTFTPTAEWSGVDFFTYTISDGNASATAKVLLQIDPVNDAPVAYGQSLSINEDESIDIGLEAKDDFLFVTHKITTYPTNGILEGSIIPDGSQFPTTGTNPRPSTPYVKYIPKANGYGTDSFVFTVTDIDGLTASATISLTVKPVNDAPVATPLALSTSTSTPKSFSAASNVSDVEGDMLTFTLATSPANGTVTSQGGSNFTYTARAGFSGNDSFSIRATDPSGANATLPVSVTVTSVPTTPNRVPITKASTVSVVEDKSVTFNLVGSDPDKDALTYLIVQQPQIGVLTANGGASFSYVPPANYFGTQTFTFQVRDARGALSNISTVTLKVTSLNDPPSFDLETNEIIVDKNSGLYQVVGFASNISVGGLPYEQGQVITFALQNSNAALFDPKPGITSDGILRFRPKAGKTGTATITVNASDNGGGSNKAPAKTFTIIVR